MKIIFKIILPSILIVWFLFAWEQQQKTPEVKKIVTFRLAEIHPSDYPTTLADKEFARLVQERTNGRINIIVYDSQKLGPEVAVLEQVQFGAIDFARTSMGPIAEFQPKLNVLQLPYIYRNSDHMWKVLNSDIGDYFLESVEEKGFIGLGWYDAGARNFYNSVKIINDVDDFKGLKFRMLENNMMTDLAEALGASVVRLPFGEVYGAIQRGIIDGAENNFPSYDTSSHYEVAKYYTIDEHVRVPEILVASPKILDRISEEDLEIIKQCAKESQEYQRNLWQEKEKESEEKMKKEGIIITQVKNKANFIQAVQPLYDKYAKEQMDIVKRIQEMR